MHFQTRYWSKNSRILVTERRGRRRKQILDIKQKKKKKKKILEGERWSTRSQCVRTRFGRGCGPVVRQTTDWLRKYERVINHWSLIHWPGYNDKSKCRLGNWSLYCVLSGKRVTVKASLIEKYFYFVTWHKKSIESLEIIFCKVLHRRHVKLCLLPRSARRFIVLMPYVVSKVG